MSKGLMFDHHLYTARNKFDEGEFFEAQQSLERILGESEGLDRFLLEGLLSLAVGFDMLLRRRMIDPALLHLQDAAGALGRIPLSTHLGLDVRRLKDELADWLDHVARLCRGEGRRSSAPPPLRLG